MTSFHWRTARTRRTTRREAVSEDEDEWDEILKTPFLTTDAEQVELVKR